MKKYLIFLVLFFGNSFLGFTQKGYVQPVSSPKIYGFLKFKASMHGGEQIIEVWKDKKDKNPKKFNIADLDEYALGKKTFRVLRNFYPFDDQETYFELVEARVIEKGRVDLLAIKPEITGGSSIMVNEMSPHFIHQNFSGFNKPLYILDCNSKNLTRGVFLEKDKFIVSVKDFFEDDFNLMKKIIDKELKFSDLRTIVRLYNEHFSKNLKE